MLEGKERMRRDPLGRSSDGGPAETILVGSIAFELAGLDLVGHPDRELWERLHKAELGWGNHYMVVDPVDRVALADGASVEEMIDFVAEELAAGGVGDAEDRIAAARRLMQ